VQPIVQLFRAHIGPKVDRCRGRYKETARREVNGRMRPAKAMRWRQVLRCEHLQISQQREAASRRSDTAFVRLGVVHRPRDFDG
jgi:hypothetical protein